MRRFVWLVWIATLPVHAAPAALAQTRTPWHVHDGLELTAENPDGLIRFSCAPTRRRDPARAAATAAATPWRPPSGCANLGPDAP